ncbi:MAG: hypothetical protein ACM359_15265 [Bacillota bacterium]
MTLSEGHLPESILTYHRQLNRDGVIPSTIFRRNHLAYTLLCHVNNIVACLLSENYHVVALLLGRAAGQLELLRKPEMKRPPEEMAYFDFVEQYLRTVTAFILERDIPPIVAEEIPVEWRLPK